ncbi:MAG: hypothetical protein IPJ97_05865 [Proteobacteria bacterium]|nr:hypothetical protein [Pseudomonadota bacterium]
MKFIGFAVAGLLCLLGACRSQDEATRVDLLIRNGTIYDGRGGAPYRGDLAVSGDRVVAIGPKLERYAAAREMDARGLAVAPGFINTLSWAPESLIHDGRAMSDIKQGVTLEIFGEGKSWGPLTPDMKAEMKNEQTDIRYDISWGLSGSFSITWSSRASLPTWRHLSVRPRCACTSWAMPIGPPARRNCRACRRWFARRCARVHSVSAAR